MRSIGLKVGEMTRANQVIAGVAAAGIVSLGSALATGIAHADTAGPESASSSSDATGSAKAASAASGRVAAKPGNGAARNAGRAGSDAVTVRGPQRPSTKLAPSATASIASADLPSETVVQQSNTSAASPESAAVAVETPVSAPPRVLPESAPAVRALVKAAAAAAPQPMTPLPVLPVLPAAATAGFMSTATGRSRVAAAAAAAQGDELVGADLADPPAQHVLVIGIDGTNISSILGDDFNQNFFDLMNTGTTAISTIVGHTTISNPSWTGILTGVWGETAGVSNNVFTPWTYDAWPTIFNQLETYNPAINTTVIADWSVIAKIAGAGSAPADTIMYYPQINDSWIDTDNEVGVASVNAIEGTAAGTPSFQFTYFVGVDETGHEDGAGSPEYKNALRNVDVNIGTIMDAVDAWELANPGEEWTVILTTDHGQNPDRAIGLLAHGFQTPIETTTFVIANGPGFAEGAVNNTYLNIDVTPTVAQLFGIAPEPYSQGKPLIDRSAYDYQLIVPGQQALHDALNAAIDMYGYPDIVTNLKLAWRTIAMTIPYVIYTAFDGIETGNEFLDFAIKFVGAIAYNIANIPAQIVARITGVSGNSILPVDFWPYTPTPGTQTEPPEPSTAEPAAAADCGSSLRAVACLAS
jgi:hypothetical protein